MRLMRVWRAYDIRLGEVGFGGGARALDSDQIVPGAQPVPRARDYLYDLALELLVLGPGHPATRLAEHDNLRTHSAFRLQQDRIHLDARLDAGGLGLYRLCASDLAAVGRDERVERHVLRLERCDVQPFAMKDSAERGDNQAFADRRRGPLHHQCPPCRASPPLPNRKTP